MPEGDTIAKLAAAMEPRLRGATLVAGRLRDAPGLSLAGRHVREVRARGKHLYVEFEGGERLRSHLGMHGSWHRYPIGKPWRRPARHASIVMETADDVFVCFHAKEVDLRRGDSIASRDQVSHLGPDLALPEVDFEEIRRRARTHADETTPLADLLLDQRVAAGIGNVYKSEVLFLKRLHPFRSVTSLEEGCLTEIFRRAHALLRANLGGGARITRDIDDGRGRAWVYRRRDLPCFECEATIESVRAGRGHRSTYWCPRCQR